MFRKKQTGIMSSDEICWRVFLDAFESLKKGLSNFAWTLWEKQKSKQIKDCYNYFRCELKEREREIERERERERKREREREKCSVIGLHTSWHITQPQLHSCSTCYVINFIDHI